jgi:acyl dehydratase
MRATLLVLGVENDKVIPMSASDEIPQCMSLPVSPPDFEWCYQTSVNQALHYRLASGDFNKIHIDPSSASLMSEITDRPILHGLCTLGIVMNGILKMLEYDVTILSLQARFTKPVMVGDAVKLEAWRSKQSPNLISFRVVLEICGSIVLDRGLLEFTTTSRVRLQSKI